MYCTKCGKLIPEGNKFCPNCGASAQPQAERVQAEVVSDTRKSALAAGLLAIFLGSLGVHNFYLHYTSKAIIQLVLTCCIVGFPASLIWSFIEGIMLLTGDIKVDGDGKPLQPLS